MRVFVSRNEIRPPTMEIGVAVQSAVFLKAGAPAGSFDSFRWSTDWLLAPLPVLSPKNGGPWGQLSIYLLGYVRQGSTQIVTDFTPQKAKRDYALRRLSSRFQKRPGNYFQFPFSAQHFPISRCISRCIYFYNNFKSFWFVII